MARVIEWDAIRPGMTVWEEWIAGTGAMKAEVKAIVSPDVMTMHYTLNTGVTFTQETKRDKQFRYWDEQPTFEEREMTPWIARKE